MIELGLAGIAAFWVLCAVLTQGIMVAEFQARFPNLAVEDFRRDLGRGLAFGLMGGPISLLVAFLTSGFAERGFQWRRK